MVAHTFYIKPGDSYEVLVGQWCGPYTPVPAPPAPAQPVPRTEHLEIRPGDCVAVVAPHATVYVKGIEPAIVEATPKAPDVDVIRAGLNLLALHGPYCINFDWGAAKAAANDERFARLLACGLIET